MPDNWLVQIPLSDLVALQGLPGKIAVMENSIAQLRREVDALRKINSEAIQLIGDLRREMRKR